MNPLDDALTAKEKLAAERKQNDLQAWQRWKEQPTPDNLHQLMQRFEPVFRQKVVQWKAPTVNDAAFKMFLRNEAINAFNTYDPNRGAALRTYLDQRLERGKRYNAQHQNYARIAEDPASLIGKITRAREMLAEDLGVEPDEVNPNAIASQLNPFLSKRRKLTGKKVEKIMGMQFKDVPETAFESDPNPRDLRREYEVIGLLRPTLSPVEQQVLAFEYGLDGQPKLKPGQMAKELGKSPSQITRLRQRLLARIDEYK